MENKKVKMRDFINNLAINPRQKNKTAGVRSLPNPLGLNQLKNIIILFDYSVK